MNCFYKKLKFLKTKDNEETNFSKVFSSVSTSHTANSFSIVTSQKIPPLTTSLPPSTHDECEWILGNSPNRDSSRHLFSSRSKLNIGDSPWKFPSSSPPHFPPTSHIRSPTTSQVWRCLPRGFDPSVVMTTHSPPSKAITSLEQFPGLALPPQTISFSSPRDVTNETICEFMTCLNGDCMTSQFEFLASITVSCCILLWGDFFWGLLEKGIPKPP